eukprot:1191255-Pyramimonas_sp.AAC.1
MAEAMATLLPRLGVAIGLQALSAALLGTLAGLGSQALILSRSTPGEFGFLPDYLRTPKKRRGLERPVKPLRRRATIGEFNSPPNYSQRSPLLGWVRLAVMLKVDCAIRSVVGVTGECASTRLAPHTSTEYSSPRPIKAAYTQNIPHPGQSRVQGAAAWGRVIGYFGVGAPLAGA